MSTARPRPTAAPPAQSGTQPRGRAVGAPPVGGGPSSVSGGHAPWRRQAPGPYGSSQASQAPTAQHRALGRQPQAPADGYSRGGPGVSRQRPPSWTGAQATAAKARPSPAVPVAARQSAMDRRPTARVGSWAPWRGGDGADGGGSVWGDQGDAEVDPQGAADDFYYQDEGAVEEQEQLEGYEHYQDEGHLEEGGADLQAVPADEDEGAAEDDEGEYEVSGAVAEAVRRFERGVGAPSRQRAAAPSKDRTSAEDRQKLPIQERRDEVVPALCGESTVCCLVGQTGSGKSTQVPQILLEEARAAGLEARIVVSQPRRVAALNLAKRVAQEMGESGPGGTVGYRIGGENVPGSHIDFCTVGYLLQLFLNQPEEFGRYSHIVLDEVHERSAENDMLCLVVRMLVSKSYPDVRVVVMSAIGTPDSWAHKSWLRQNEKVRRKPISLFRISPRGRGFAGSLRPRCSRTSSRTTSRR